MINWKFSLFKKKKVNDPAGKNLTNSREDYLDKLIKRMNARAVIFDLDGTLIDNNSFHLISWKRYLKNIGKDISEEEYRVHINGRTNKDAIEYIYGRKMKDEEAMEYALQKEEIYRSLYKPLIKPVPGLVQFLTDLNNHGIPMAIATSGIQVNIDFMFDNIPIRHFFKTVINSTHITYGKPDPEIYYKTAKALSVPTRHCLVFEDSVVGIQAAKAAKMRVIAVSTTHTKEELSDADMIIENYKPESFSSGMLS